VPLNIVMDIDKLIKGGLWLSGFSISVIFTALSLYIGFNNYRHGNSTILIIGFSLIPIVYYCAYKGFKLLMDAFFK